MPTIQVFPNTRKCIILWPRRLQANSGMPTGTTWLWIRIQQPAGIPFKVSPSELLLELGRLTSLCLSIDPGSKSYFGLLLMGDLNVQSVDILTRNNVDQAKEFFQVSVTANGTEWVGANNGIQYILDI